MLTWQGRLPLNYMFDVIVVGDSAWDTIVRVAEVPEFNRDIPAHVQSGPGGQGLNMAVASARAGARTALVTQVGNDAESRHLVDWLAQVSVELVDLIARDPLTRVISLVRSDGERALMTDAGPGPTQVPSAGITARVLVLSGYLLDRPQGVASFHAWLGYAKTHQMIVVWDVAHPRLAATGQSFLSQVDWVMANEQEWTALGRPDCPAAMVKCGAKGAQLLVSADVVDITSPAVPVVDTTGAGDAVAGTFAARLALGDSTLAAARRAVVSGSEACSHVGAVRWA